MLHRQARIVARLGVLFALALFSSCTCYSSAEVINDTDSPLFANTSFVPYDWEGQRLEEEGVLIPPHSRATLSEIASEFLRVRDMSGNTVAFQEISDGEDVELTVSSLEPLPDPEPLGIPYWFESEGLEGSFSHLCRDGHGEQVPLFRMNITIRSNYDGPLIVSGVGDCPDRNDDPREIRGFLVPPLGEVRLGLRIVDQAWIRAFDPEARLVFTQAVPKEPRPVVMIPSSLPSEPEPIPAPGWSWPSWFFGYHCSHSSDLTALATVVLALVGVGVLFVLAALGGVWWWRRRRAKTR